MSPSNSNDSRDGTLDTGTPDSLILMEAGEVVRVIEKEIPFGGLDIRFGFESNHQWNGQERLWGAFSFAAPGALIIPIASFAVAFTGLDPWDAMLPTISAAGLPHLPLPRSR
jgi:hypothetical protein